MADRTAGGVKDGEIVAGQRILKICQKSSSGGDSLEEELVNSGALNLRVSFKPLTRVFCADLHKQTRIATTKFVWTVVILSCIEASEPLLNGRTLKMHS